MLEVVSTGAGTRGLSKQLSRCWGPWCRREQRRRRGSFSSCLGPPSLRSHESATGQSVTTGGRGEPQWLRAAVGGGAMERRRPYSPEEGQPLEGARDVLRPLPLQLPRGDIFLAPEDTLPGQDSWNGVLSRAGLGVWALATALVVHCYSKSPSSKGDYWDSLVMCK